MKTKVYKYTFEYTEDGSVSLPKGYKPLKVAIQHGVPCLWALVDVEADNIKVPYAAYKIMEDVHTLTLSKDSKIVGITGTDNNEIFLWVLKTDQPWESSKIVVVGTGWSIESTVKENLYGEYKFIDSVMLENGSLVFHVFEKEK